MDLEAIKRMLLVKYPAFSGIVLNTRFIERKEVITAATDGKSSMPKQYCNCIWVVFGDKKIEPKGGKVIYIDQNELVKRKTK